MALDSVILSSWRQFWCSRCGRLISECRPAIYLAPDQPNTLLPTVEYIDSCAMCAQTGKKP